MRERLLLCYLLGWYTCAIFWTWDLIGKHQSPGYASIIVAPILSGASWLFVGWLDRRFRRRDTGF